MPPSLWHSLTAVAAGAALGVWLGMRATSRGRRQCQAGRCSGHVAAARAEPSGASTPRAPRSTTTAAQRGSPEQPPSTEQPLVTEVATISFMGDVEGSLAFVRRFVDSSPVLRWSKTPLLAPLAPARGDDPDAAKDKDKAKGRTKPQDGGEPSLIHTLEFVDPSRQYFVFGGDLFDNGPWDATLSSLLVDFKRRYPDRVFLLMGNRDINKLRLTAELGADDMKRPLEEVEVVPGVGDVTVKEYLERLSKERPQSTVTSLNTVATRLKYSYRHTLGCPRTFEWRRLELWRVRQLADSPWAGNGRVPVAWVDEEDRDLVERHMAQAQRSVTDQDVVDDVLRANRPDGWLFGYLRSAQIGLVLFDTVFVHGSIKASNMGVVPSLRVRYRHARGQKTNVPARLATDAGSAERLVSVRRWVAALNRFADTALDEFQQRPGWNKDRTSRGGEALMAWQSSPASVQQTPVVVSYLQKGELLPVSATVVDYLRTHGIRRVCVGHKPVGDVPLVARLAGGVELVVADLTRSDASAHDRRGAATAEVLVGIQEHVATVDVPGAPRVVHPVLPRRQLSELRVHGVTARGRPYSFVVGAGSHPSLDPYVGLVTGDGFFVKARLLPRRNEQYLLCRTRNRKEERRVVSRAELERLPQLTEVPTF